MTSGGGSVPERLFRKNPPYKMTPEEVHLHLLRRLEQNPECTQRELANEMGISLGKVNYCMKKLIEKGWVKAKNFYHSPNKSSHTYLLTKKGIEFKGKLTVEFIRRKMEEYEMLKSEISQLQAEVEE